jgi:hypothetical protein
LSKAEEVREKARAFDHDLKYRHMLDKALDLARKFNERYPWRSRPQLIDSLTHDDLYNPGHPGYFFDWIEHKLKALGHIYIGHAGVWENASNNISEFKVLMKTAVDDNKPLYQKIDAPWQDIKLWGGDKHIAKKIVICFYPDINIYAFKTSDLERFCELMGIARDVIEKESNSRYGEVYDALTMGKRYQLLNDLLQNFKNSLEETRDWHNNYFMRFLYSTFREELSPRAAQLTRGLAPSFKPLIGEGLLFDPRTEQEVPYIFARHHRKLGFAYIKRIQQDFPDVIALDDRGDEKRIELELFASEFESHRHPPQECDFIVCWENDKPNPPANWPKIIALKDVME